MDISLYISELLFEHDCIIIPNFGGFIGNYKPADIHPVQNTITPPAKSISFNRNLQTNDGLLVNYIAVSQNISFDAAYDIVSNWVISSKQLLAQKEELRLKKIGQLTSDTEGKIHFAPTEEVNYLKTSFGLKAITVQPVLRERGRQIEFTEKFVQETKHTAGPRANWRIAATVLLLISLVALAELMWMGVSVKPLQLNEASVFGFVGNIFRAPEPELKPIAAAVEAIAPIVNSTPEITIDSAFAANEIATETAAETSAAVKEEINAPVASNGHTYYIIIGAFAEQKNIEAAKGRLHSRFPDSVVYEERGKRITKLGYSVGYNYKKALQQLSTAQSEDADYWLLKK